MMIHPYSRIHSSSTYLYYLKMSPKPAYRKVSFCAEGGNGGHATRRVNLKHAAMTLETGVLLV